MKNVIRTVAVVLGLGACSSAVHAEHFESDLVREAHRVVDYADDLRAEVSKHFRHTAEYRHLVSDAASIRKDAKHIDSLSHHVHGISDVRHLRADLVDLDKLVHHVADLITRIGRGHVRGHTHGDTRHVRDLVARMNRSLHSMEATVREMEHHFSRPVECEPDRGRGYSRGRPSHARYDNRSVGEQIASSVLREVLRHR